MCLLFPDLNEDKTVARVNSFLKEDVERLMRMCGRDMTDLSSPQLSQAPSHSNYINSAEVKMIRGLNAEAIVEAVYDAINHCSDDSKSIIIALYVEHDSWIYVQRLLCCSQNKLSYLRHRALLEFADCFDYWQRVHKCEPILDLHCYE